MSNAGTPDHSAAIEVENSPEELAEIFERFGWGDGLPVVAPTPERVKRMLTGTRRSPDEEIARLPPRYGKATVEKIAINAVVAGCRPEYLPVVIAVVEAMTQPQFNLVAIQATTHPAAPLAVVNGPIRQKIGLNCGAGMFGPGWRANATIGRAIRLILLNIGGGTPGVADRSTMGSPAKYTYCIGENQEESPWTAHHVEGGANAGTSTVTVFGAEAPHNVNDHVSTSPDALLTVVADGMAKLGSNNTYAARITEMLLVLCPEHAATIARAGWTKEDVRHYLYDQARQPMKRLKIGGMWGMQQWPRWFDALSNDAMVPIVATPQRIVIIVAGGPGKHSAVIPTSGTTQSAVAAIED